jgi:hypothetical protein
MGGCVSGDRVDIGVVIVTTVGAALVAVSDVMMADGTMVFDVITIAEV